MREDELVYIDQHGLLGSNFYWHKYESKGMTKEDILSAGLVDDRVRIHRDVLRPLLAADSEFRKRGYRIYLKEGYRSSALYDIIYRRRVEKFGREETDRILNMEGRPHANGKSLDLALWSVQGDKEVYMRRGEDGLEALFVDFYKGKEDALSQQYQELQEWVISIMQALGFRLGIKREYFHFDYRPDEPENY